MKKSILYFVFFIFFNTSSHAQSTLQFSQALLVNSSTATVPAGKVWKITGVFYSSQLPDPYCTGSTSCGAIAAFNDVILIGGTSVTVRSVRSRGNTYQLTTYSWEQQFQHWLPAGTSLAASTGVLAISVLEFTIGP